MNWQRLQQLFGGDEELVKKFMAVFQSEMPKLAASLETAAAAGDWDEVSNTAHIMKSQLNYAGFEAQAQLALRIEKNAEKRLEVEGLPGLVKELTEMVIGDW